MGTDGGWLDERWFYYGLTVSFRGQEILLKIYVPNDLITTTWASIKILGKLDKLILMKSQFPSLHTHSHTIWLLLW